MAYLRERMLNLKIGEEGIFRQNVFKEYVQLGNVPLSVSQIIDAVIFCFFLCDMEKRIESSVCRDHL